MELIDILSKEKRQQIINELNPNFDYLTEFKGLRKDITRKCKICGDVRTVKARSLYEKDKYGNYRSCPVCKSRERGKLLRKTHNKFVEEMKIINPHIEFLSEYTTNSDKIKCKCLIDGHEWETMPYALLGGHGCPECANRLQNRRTEEQFIKEMKQKHPTIIPRSYFKKVNKSMKFECLVCGYIWNTCANVLLNRDGYGCPECSGYARVSEEEFIERLTIANSKIKYISGYKDTTKHAIFECLNCGNIWNTLPTSVLRGRGCPKCSKSKGELAIENVLCKLGIDYESQFTFKDCKNIRPLPFDFYIPSKNICIEYDGEQHFKPIRFDKHNKRGTPQERFEELKIRDEIKNNFCKDNKIKLIRIPYTEFDNIETILNEQIA